MTADGQTGHELVTLTVRRWRAIAIFVIAGTAGAVGYSLLAPSWYSATLTVVQSQHTQSALMASISSKLPDGFDTGSVDAHRIEAVLTSTSVADSVIEKFKLKERYGVDYQEHARNALAEHCVANVDKKSGVVSLTCEDKDPQIAMDMTAYFGEVGNAVFGRVSATSAREERKFLETQVAKARADVDEASRKLREFQELHHVVDLPEQSKAVISAMASIQGQLLSKQLEVSYLSRFSAPTEGGVVQLEQQIAIMKQKLGELESSRTTEASTVASATSLGSASSGSAATSPVKPTGSTESFFPGAMNVPALRFELEQLIREQKIQETVFFMLTQRYEMAKVDEARDTSTFQILDRPTLPTHRSRPKRKRIAVIGVGGGFAAGLMWVLVPAWWERSRLRSSLKSPAIRT